MIVTIENKEMALTSIALCFTSKERLQFTPNTIFFDRAEMSTSVNNLEEHFEL